MPKYLANRPGNLNIFVKLVNSNGFVTLAIYVDSFANRESSQFLKNVPKDVSEMAFQILKIICSEIWVKEKCLKDVKRFVEILLVSIPEHQI